MISDTPSSLPLTNTDQPVLEGYDLINHDWEKPGPVLVRAFHGTTHQFEDFSLERSTHQGQFGKVHYFTSCEDDALVNYANQFGPDITTRVCQRTDELENMIYEDPEAYGLSEDASSLDIKELAQNMARSDLVGPTSRVLDLRLQLNKPFVIDAIKVKNLPFFEEELSMADAICSVADETGLSVEEIENDWETHEDAIYEVLDQAYQDQHESLAQAFRAASNELNCTCPNVPDFIYPLAEINCNQFEQSLIKEDRDIFYLLNDECESVSHTFFSKVLEHLGFDSIVLLNADRRFSSMNMISGTTHIHLMESAKAQINLIEAYETCDA
jgi:hypothetical protein